MTAFSAHRLHHPQAGQAVPGGGIEQVTLDDLSEGDTVIQVAYTSLNFKDALAVAGRGKIIRDYPRITGIDFTGRVIQSENPALTPGMAVVVHGFGVGISHDGGHAQVARVHSEWVMPLPEGLSLLDAATIGAAGYTAGLSLHLMEHNGLQPNQGPILVTGATGGVASIAIDILHQRGYQVAALTGKPQAHDLLRSLGVDEFVEQPDTSQISALAKGRWAGAIDSVGGPLLAWIASSTLPEGVIAAFGNAGGADVPTTVYPFILRGVKLLGINASSPMPLRQIVWEKLATSYRPRHLTNIRRLITIDQAPLALQGLLERQNIGRTVIDMNTEL